MKIIHSFRSIPWRFRLGLCLALSATILFGSGFWAWANGTDLGTVGILNEPEGEHVDQDELRELVANGELREAFEEAFELGDELFATTFNALDGVGANVGQGQHFTRVPRADLNGPGEWANHIPPRATGPNADTCSACHNQPFEDGAGSAALNVHRDPLHSGDMDSFIQRNTPHLFAIGAVQRLSEEMTEELQSIFDGARDATCREGQPISQPLSTKGVDFGTITVTPPKTGPCTADTVGVTTSGVNGVDADLIVRPFQWKGSKAFIRQFNRDASHDELGMQPMEIVGDGVDGDFDGIVDELTIGDQTALAVYLAAQPRPQP